MTDKASGGERADRSVPSPPASLRLTVDRDALAANWRALDALSGSAKAGAAVKADAYGLGAATCVPVLRDAGCETFFVAHWSEVEAVIAHVPPQQVAVLHGVQNEAECAYARAVGAVPVINSLEQADVVDGERGRALSPDGRHRHQPARHRGQARRMRQRLPRSTSTF